MLRHRFVTRETVCLSVGASAFEAQHDQYGFPSHAPGNEADFFNKHDVRTYVRSRLGLLRLCHSEQTHTQTQHTHNEHDLGHSHNSKAKVKVKRVAAAVGAEAKKLDTYRAAEAAAILLVDAAAVDAAAVDAQQTSKKKTQQHTQTQHKPPVSHPHRKLKASAVCDTVQLVPRQRHTSVRELLVRKCFVVLFHFTKRRVVHSNAPPPCISCTNRKITIRYQGGGKKARTTEVEYFSSTMSFVGPRG